jgi:dTDP-4-dehydrorhamnose reductase
LLTGPTGQVGAALLARLPALGEVIPMDRAALDLARPESIRQAVRAIQPQVIVNAAAYTAVDRAENEEDMAWRINGDGPAQLAQEAARLGAFLVHFSTDYVFDGRKESPYVEDDRANPVNAYGRSKLAGERAVAASGCRYLIFRTSWVYAASGRNFLLSILKTASEGQDLRVVDDAFGAPTSSRQIAAAVVEAIAQTSEGRSAGGLYHLSAAGSTTWFNFAAAILRCAKLRPALVPISASEYRAPARRPRNSLLDNSKIADVLKIRLPSWEGGLEEVMRELGRI